MSIFAWIGGAIGGSLAAKALGSRNSSNSDNIDLGGPSEESLSRLSPEQRAESARLSELSRQSIANMEEEERRSWSGS